MSCFSVEYLLMHFCLVFTLLPFLKDWKPNPIQVMKLKTATQQVSSNLTVLNTMWIKSNHSQKKTAIENNGIFCFWKNLIVETKLNENKTSTPATTKSPNYSQCICFLTLVPHALQLDIMSHGMSWGHCQLISTSDCLRLCGQ